MKRAFVVAALSVCALGANAWADVTVKGVNYISPMGANDLPDMTVKKGSTDYTVYYKDNQFRMDNAGGLTMIIREKGNGVEYVMINHGKKQYYVLHSVFASTAEYLTKAKASGALSGGTIDDNLKPDPRLGYETKGARFWLKGVVMPFNEEFARQMGGNASVPSEYADMLSIEMDINGMAIVAPEMPGADEVAAFYDNMEEKIAAGEGALGTSGGINPSLIRGMTMVMAKVVHFGMPLLVMQTTEIKVKTHGLPSQVASMIESTMGNAMGTGADDVAMTEVVDVDTGPLDADLFYGGAYPPGYREVDAKKASKWK